MEGFSSQYLSTMNDMNKTPANRRRNNDYMLMSTRLIRFIRQSYQMCWRLTSTCSASATHDNTLNNVVLFSFVGIIFRAHFSFLHIVVRILLDSHAILFCSAIELNLIASFGMRKCGQARNCLFANFFYPPNCSHRHHWFGPNKLGPFMRQTQLHSYGLLTE